MTQRTIGKEPAMPEDDDILQTIRRREARSGRVSFSDPVVLHSSHAKRVELVPFFVHRTEGTELAIKIILFRPSALPSTGQMEEKKFISLNEQASRRLLSGLHSLLRVAEEDADGSYFVIRISERAPRLRGIDPATAATALINALSSDEIIHHLSDAELTAELTAALRGAIHLKEMREAISTLHSHLDAGEVNEQIYQEWCEQHTWAFGNAYVMRDRVRNISIGDRIDFLMPTVISGFRDIVELKRPDFAVLGFDSQHNNYYFSGEVSKAIGQCHRYLDILHEVAAQGLLDHPEIVAYHPRAMIVIGRSNTWDPAKLKALHGLNCRLNGISILTYDQLLAQGERLIDMLSTRPSGEEPAEEFPSADEDDSPF
jgi:hypothetical protein